MILTPRYAAILIRIMSADQPVTYLDIGRDDGRYPNGEAQTWATHGWSLAVPLYKSRVIAKCGRRPLRYEITEKGRIAVALFRAIENRKAAQS